MYGEIKRQFADVITYSQQIFEPDIDDLFDRWQTSKQKFIDRFGGLIYEFPDPIEFTLDDKIKTSKAMEFADQIQGEFGNYDLAMFIDANLSSFFENKVSNTLDYNNIPKGMKLLKAFKYFESDPEALRIIQDRASLLIQENCIKGTLCFSVHPLDFLSSSENTYNWRSCHALDGEYRAGNLSYMVDTSTFMVYLRGADNVSLNSFGPVKWNSKKWRMLVHVSNDDSLMFAGRQYPFDSKNGLDQILNIYNGLMSADKYDFAPPKYEHWCADYIDEYTTRDHPQIKCELYDKYIPIYGFLGRLGEVVRPGNEALNYNDVLYSSCYKYPNYAMIHRRSYVHNRLSIVKLLEDPIIIGDSVKCLCCGNHTITNHETMRCDKCELDYGYEENDSYGSCNCCGARIYFDDSYVIGDEYVCDNCYENECFNCDVCGEAYFNHDRHYVKFDETNSGYVCNYCYMHSRYLMNRRDY